MEVNVQAMQVYRDSKAQAAQVERPPKTEITAAFAFTLQAREKMTAFNLLHKARSVRLYIIVTLALNASCATTIKYKMLEHSLIAGSIGAIYGATRPEQKEKNTMMFGSMGLALGAIASIYLQEPDTKINSLTMENQKLKSDLDEIQNPKLEFSSSGFLNSKVPDKYKRLINPGEWRVYKLDQWVEDGENRVIHQDKIMELIPPTLRTNIKEEK